MPVYVYRDPVDGTLYEEVFAIAEAPAAIQHPTIKNRWAERHYTPISINAKKELGSFYSPAFGKEFKNEHEQKAYAKDMGMVAVENASLDSIMSWEKTREQDREKQLDADLENIVRNIV